MPPGADYSMFKEGIFPDWEDPRNQDGGRWVIAMDKRKRELLDTYWLEIMFFLIGEHADQHAYQVEQFFMIILLLIKILFRCLELLSTSG